MESRDRWAWGRAVVAVIGVGLTTAGLGQATGAGVVYAAPVVAPYLLVVRSRAGAVVVGGVVLAAAARVGVDIGGLGPESEAMGGGFFVSFAAGLVVLGVALVERLVASSSRGQRR